MDFSPIEKHIQKGQLDLAKRRLKKVDLETLATGQLLIFFRYLRRVGEFHHGSLAIEKFETAGSELDLERAYFLSELGAYKQALGLLQNNFATKLNIDQQIEKQFYIGHCSSLSHDYTIAITAFESMAKLAEKERPVQFLIARLNQLGHAIYAKQNLTEQIAALKELKLALTNYPLLEQGTYYFLSLAYLGLNDVTSAKKELKNALETQAKHRLRESLLLKMTDFELNGSDFTKPAISRLKKNVLEQDHIIYFDQFNKIMGRLLHQNQEPTLASKYFNKVLYGQRPSAHLDEVTALADKENLNATAWMIDGIQAKPMTAHQIIYNQVERNDPPYLTSGKNVFSLNAESENARGLVLHLARNFEFQMREAELWQSIWKETYLYSYSIDRVKALLYRIRKSEIKDFTQIQYKKHKLGVIWNKQTSLIVKV